MNSADLIQHVFSIHKFDTVILVHNDNYDNRHHNDKFGNSFSLTHVSLMGTHIVMEAAKHSGHIQKFIYISSDELYGRVTSKANVSEDCKSVGEDISEESKDQEQPMPDPRNPYAACMLGAEHLIKSYFKSFRFPAILVRVCNTFGPKQPMDRFIPKSINSLLHGQSCTVHGDGSNSRYWLYVSDFVNAIDLIIKNGAVGQTYNVGAEQATSNLEALKAIVRIVDKSKQEASVLKYEPDRQLDDRRYKLDTASMRALGWQPDISFETGIRLTAMWIECKVNAAE